MAFRAAESVRVQLENIGFFANRGAPRLMSRPHAHTDIECNFLLAGRLTYLHGGRYYQLEPDQFVAFWAGIPHRLLEAQQCEMVWLVLPLAWYMQWQLPGSLTSSLLAGEMVVDAGEASDRMGLSRWAADFSRTDTDMQRILILEIEARFRRLARALQRNTPQRPSLTDATASHAESLAGFMAAHYREPLSVARIAASVNLHPNYAMQVFKQRCGMSIWDYLTRLRISHAQRLLLTSDWKVHHIAMESGFATPSRFYEAFTRLARKTPRQYRQARGSPGSRPFPPGKSPAAQRPGPP